MNSTAAETIQLNGQALDAVYHIDGQVISPFSARLGQTYFEINNGTFNQQPTDVLGGGSFYNAGTERNLNLVTYIAITEPAADVGFLEYYSLEAGSFQHQYRPGHAYH